MFRVCVLVGGGSRLLLRGRKPPTIDQYKPFRGKFDSPRLKTRSLT